MEYMHIFLVVWGILNVTAFALYGIDKYKAAKNKWRVKESTLLAIAFFGSVGAAAGMNLFRHKTRKPIFKLVYLFLILDLCAIVLFHLWKNGIV